MYRLARPVLFRVGGGDAEAAHEWTMKKLAVLTRRPALVQALTSWYGVSAPRKVFGLHFPNPVGLAAGMDKDGRVLTAWPALGFGFVEVGTVTWHPQPGNPRPRVFRLRASEAVINRMGFNNAGARALADRLARLGPLGRTSASSSGPADRVPPGNRVPLGISLGKSKVTLLEEAVGDYLASLRVLYPFGDYFAVNVSSPNTPGLRSLQNPGHLDELIAALVHEARLLASAGPVKPLLVKIAPDLTDVAIAEVLEVCQARGVAGVIATNTTLARSGLAPADVATGAQDGGLSGRPLNARAREVVAFIHRETAGTLPIIGVGGVLDPDDAIRLVDVGASLVQLYTGLIYRGPALVRQTARALAQHPTR